MAVAAWGAAVQSRKKISRREVQWLTVMLMARQQLVLLAMQQNLRSRRHRALARTARTQHGDVRSVQQPQQLPLVWGRTQQTLTRHSQHPSLMSCRTMQTWMHMQILARMQLPRRIQVQTRCRCRCTSAQVHLHLRTQMQMQGAGADACAALPTGGASKRKRGCPRVAKRGRASAHGPGTYVYDEVQAARDSALYTCGAVLTPAGHALNPAIHCNVALTCVALVESTLYNMSASAMKQPLVEFSKGLFSIFGMEQVSDEELKEQGYSGNRAKKWAACPLCVGCAAQGFKASSVRKTRTQSKRIAREQNCARAVPAPRLAAARKGASEASSDYGE
jgi:hypothetical protein